MSQFLKNTCWGFLAISLVFVCILTLSRQISVQTEWHIHRFLMLVLIQTLLMIDTLGSMHLSLDEMSIQATSRAHHLIIHRIVLMRRLILRQHTLGTSDEDTWYEWDFSGEYSPYYDVDDDGDSDTEDPQIYHNYNTFGPIRSGKIISLMKMGKGYIRMELYTKRSLMI